MEQEGSDEMAEHSTSGVLNVCDKEHSTNNDIEQHATTSDGLSNGPYEFGGMHPTNELEQQQFDGDAGDEPEQPQHEDQQHVEEYQQQHHLHHQQHHEHSQDVQHDQQVNEFDNNPIQHEQAHHQMHDANQYGEVQGDSSQTHVEHIDQELHETYDQQQDIQHQDMQQQEEEQAIAVDQYTQQQQQQQQQQQHQQQQQQQHTHFESSDYQPTSEHIPSDNVSAVAAIPISSRPVRPSSPTIAEQVRRVLDQQAGLLPPPPFPLENMFRFLPPPPPGATPIQQQYHQPVRKKIPTVAKRGVGRPPSRRTRARKRPTPLVAAAPIEEPNHAGVEGGGNQYGTGAHGCRIPRTQTNKRKHTEFNQQQHQAHIHQQEQLQSRLEQELETRLRDGGAENVLDTRDRPVTPRVIQTYLAQLALHLHETRRELAAAAAAIVSIPDSNFGGNGEPYNITNGVQHSSENDVISGEITNVQHEDLQEEYEQQGIGGYEDVGSEQLVHHQPHQYDHNQQHLHEQQVEQQQQQQDEHMERHDLANGQQYNQIDSQEHQQLDNNDVHEHTENESREQGNTNTINEQDYQHDQQHETHQHADEHREHVHQNHMQEGAIAEQQHHTGSYENSEVMTENYHDHHQQQQHDQGSQEHHDDGQDIEEQQQQQQHGLEQRHEQQQHEHAQQHQLQQYENHEHEQQQLVIQQDQHLDNQQPHLNQQSQHQQSHNQQSHQQQQHSSWPPEGHSTEEALRGAYANTMKERTPALFSFLKELSPSTPSSQADAPAAKRARTSTGSVSLYFAQDLGALDVALAMLRNHRGSNFVDYLLHGQLDIAFSDSAAAVKKEKVWMKRLVAKARNKEGVFPCRQEGCIALGTSEHARDVHERVHRQKSKGPLALANNTQRQVNSSRLSDTQRMGQIGTAPAATSNTRVHHATVNQREQYEMEYSMMNGNGSQIDPNSNGNRNDNCGGVNHAHDIIHRDPNGNAVQFGNELNSMMENDANEYVHNESHESVRNS